MQQPAAPYYPPSTPYPLTFKVDYPDRNLNRLTTGLRFLWIIPIGIIARVAVSWRYTMIESPAYCV